MAAKPNKQNGSTPNNSTANTSPAGERMATYLGHGKLRPGIGLEVRRTGVPAYCGDIVGHAIAFEEHPNTKDPTKVSTCFLGQWKAFSHTGEQIGAGAACYLPPVLTRVIKAALKRDPQHVVPVAVSISCEPDREGSTPSAQGYSFAVFDRRPTPVDDPVLLLAYESGIMKRPAPALPAASPMAAPTPAAGEYVDPETGEITVAPPAGAGLAQAAE